MLEWTHDKETCPLNLQPGKTPRPINARCTGDTACPEFPTIKDRCDMAHAAFEAYAEADGTAFNDFLRDVMLLFMRSGNSIGELHTEAMIAYMLLHDLEVPEELAL